MKERIHYIDIAKAFAIFFIVFGHVIVHSENSDLTLRFVCSFHVVLFFVLSGYTFNTNKPFKEFISQRFSRIMIPYFIWAVLFLVPYFILGGKAGEQLGTEQSFNIVTLLKNILYGNGNSANLKQNSSLWFLPSLFTIEVFYYAIIKFSKNNKKREILFGIILLICGYISANYNKVILPWGINTMINIGIFFYIGYILSERKILDKFNVYWQTIISLVIGVFCCFYGNAKHISYIDFYYGNYIYMILSGTFLSIFTISLSKIINENKILEYVGKNTMGILIFHKLFVLIFQTKLGALSQLLMSSNLLVETILAIIISIIAISLSLVVNLPIKKYAPFLLGERKKLAIKEK